MTTISKAIIFSICLLCIFLMANSAVMKRKQLNRSARKTQSGRLMNELKHVLMKRSAINDPSTFETKATGKRLLHDVHPLFRNTLRDHPNTFVQSGDEDTTPLLELMCKVNSFADNHWEKQRDAIGGDLTRSGYMYFLHSDKIRGSRSKDDFFKQIISRYTSELESSGTQLYSDVNRKLRDISESNDSPLGSFSLMLNVVLLQWDQLQKCSGLTYRGVSFSPSEYTEGTTFGWPSFTSTSRNEAKSCRFAKTILFVIDNSVSSAWNPKKVDNYSQFDEEECLYPAISMFTVTKVANGGCGETSIKTIMLSRIDVTDARCKRDVTGAAGKGNTAELSCLLIIISALVPWQMNGIW